MNRHQYKDLTIEVFDDPAYKYGAADNIFNYSNHYFSEGAEEYPTSKHAVKVYLEDQVIYSCILIGSGGATGLHQNSSLIDDDRLVICCCDSVFCLSLPNLDLRWKVQADQATCFQVFKLQEDYLVHGELQITRLDKAGKVKWQLGGADIFVSLGGEDEFKLERDHIMLTDFGRRIYKIDFDGRLL
jgi:hypothetical protein